MDDIKDIEAEKKEDDLTAEEQNLENNNDAGKEITEDPDEVEIVVEGEEEPASIPTYQFKKRLARSSRKVDAANTAQSKAEEKALMFEEENKLLRLQAQQGKPQKRPAEDDFETDAEYQTALTEFDDARIATEVKKQTSQVMQANQTQAVQNQSTATIDKQVDEHYKRSAELKVPDYEATETVAVDILGDEVSRQIVANSKASQVIMYHLGKNPAKAQQLKALIASNPMAGVMELGRLEATLKIKPKTKNAPDPENKLPNGGSLSNDDGGVPGATYE